MILESERFGGDDRESFETGPRGISSERYQSMNTFLKRFVLFRFINE